MLAGTWPNIMFCGIARVLSETMIVTIWFDHKLTIFKQVFWENISIPLKMSKFIFMFFTGGCVFFLDVSLFAIFC